MKDFDTQWLMSRMQREQAKRATVEPIVATAPDAVGLESDLHDQIIAECRRRGWIPVHSRLDVPTTTAKGVPDFIILASEGRLFLFEAKNKKGKLKPEQIGFAMMSEQLGHTVHVVRAFSEFLAVIDTPTKTTP